MNEDYKCNVCNTPGLKHFLSLGNIPPVNAFISEKEIDSEIAYPLNLMYCPSCSLIQLNEIVTPGKLFSNYLHLSSASDSNIKHLQEVANIINNKFHPNKNTKILEIGSNDGTLLSFLKKYTDNIIGVDPAKNLITIAAKLGIKNIPEFFTEKFASELLKINGSYDLVIALNVIPHTPDVVDLLKGINTILSKEGVLIMEGVYGAETILEGEFDTVYHEHVYTFSLHSIISTFKQADLAVIDVEKISTQGGSLRIYAKRNNLTQSINQSVTNLLEEEKEKGLTNNELYNSINEKVIEYKEKLNDIIKKEKEKGGKLIGLGAPARGVVILNYCNIGKEDIEFIIDDTPLKQGRMIPGVHIPIKSWDVLSHDNKRSFLLLSWNYQDHFINKIKERFKYARIIIPFPKLEVKEIG